MSSFVCGCDPEAQHHCDIYPMCTYGKSLQVVSKPWQTREERPEVKVSPTACSVEEVKAFRQRLYAESVALIDKKGADYNRDQQNTGDTLFNLRVCELLGIVPSAEEGILVRLSDKFMRLISLTKPGREAAVKDESVLDTIKDIHNYVDYLGLVWQKRRGQ